MGWPWPQLYDRCKSSPWHYLEVDRKGCRKHPHHDWDGSRDTLNATHVPFAIFYFIPWCVDFFQTSSYFCVPFSAFMFSGKLHWITWEVSNPGSKVMMQWLKAYNYSWGFHFWICLPKRKLIFKTLKLFQLDDSKSLHEQWVFHQTSKKQWLFRVPGVFVFCQHFWWNQKLSNIFPWCSTQRLSKKVFFGWVKDQFIVTWCDISRWGKFTMLMLTYRTHFYWNLEDDLGFTMP